MSSQASVEASACGAQQRASLRSSFDEKRISSAAMAEATPALYRWQGKKGVVDAELAKSHVWAAEGDEFCVQDSKPHALLVSVEGVPGLKLITPDEARRMGCAPRPAVPSWRRASMAPTGMTPSLVTTPSMTASASHFLGAKELP